MFACQFLPTCFPSHFFFLVFVEFYFLNDHAMWKDNKFFCFGARSLVRLLAYFFFCGFFAFMEGYLAALRCLSNKTIDFFFPVVSHWWQCHNGILARFAIGNYSWKIHNLQFVWICTETNTKLREYPDISIWNFMLNIALVQYGCLKMCTPWQSSFKQIFNRTNDHFPNVHRFSRDDVAFAISFMTERKHGTYVVWIWNEKKNIAYA